MPRTIRLASLTRLAPWILLVGLLSGLAACSEAPPPPDRAAAAPPAADAGRPSGDAGQADDTAAAPADSEAASPANLELPGEPAMWQLADADTTVHLFGTIHVLRPEIDWRTDRFDRVFEAADAVYFEADVMSPSAQADIATLVRRRGVFTDGRKLTALLDAEERELVRDAMQTLGVPMSAVEPMKPWLATVQMSTLALQAQGYEVESGVETVLTERAEAAGKTLRFLETAAEQLDLIASVPEDDQVAFLVASARQLHENPDLLDDLVAAWAKGDVARLGELMSDPDLLGSETVHDRLIVQRNRNWVEQIETLMDEEAGTFLLAVGAGHLAGPDSVQTLLRAEGYTVEGP